jgi:hypothetical protein
MIYVTPLCNGSLQHAVNHNQRGHQVEVNLFGHWAEGFPPQQPNLPAEASQLNPVMRWRSLNLAPLVSAPPAAVTLQ